MKTAYSNSIKWSIFIFILTFVLACIFSVTSTIILEGVGWGAGMFIVFIIMVVGIVFDMMGIASTAAQEAPLHAMAAARVKGSRHALIIVRNADRFSNFCNDVVGDVCGIISGAASAIVILKLLQAAAYADHGAVYTAVTVLFTAFVSAMTVGGKALGKTYAIVHSQQIVVMVGKLLHIAEHRLGMKLFRGRKNKGNKGKRGKANATR